MYLPTGPRVRILTREQVLEAVAAYEAGETLTTIGNRYGVTGGAIHYHVARHTILRSNRVKPTVCPEGHPIDGRGRTGKRWCKTCARNKYAARKAVV